MTEPTRTYALPSLNELTLNDAFAIKSHTGVDVLRPPTVAHGDAALLWFVSRKGDTPLVYKDLLNLSFTELSALIEAQPEDDDDDDDDQGDEPVGDEDDSPKASASSTPAASDSPAAGDAPQPASGNAPSESSGS